MGLLQSACYFFWGILKRFYCWLPFVVLDIPDLWQRYLEPFASARFGWELKMPDTFTSILVLASLAWAGVLTYHELRQQKIRLESQLGSVNNIRTIVEDLLSVGIYSDIPVNITRILYHDRERLAVGLSNDVTTTSNQDKLVLAQLNIRKIVRFEQRKERVYGSDNVQDKGYWILTELGKDVILFLQKNQQVLDREGSLSK